ncbi:DNA-directed RNA polymerases I, II, and III subunit RPABC5 [Nosema bombycis CQ1]|uniref:DNA-directed RNA polymerases I, II, and III subunit RPABC5 n=1 Tax=Nosema bombycis (strain CQ1 / CVCC 102059) TaxID=578461 RepID=R0MI02_NOSB1|nr:DNA-directed RNA polymerases I, II, and III subunit RPABC5 [Nosema bombycis CQ1]|eukprot:EOB12388.1 DNA-directed RNA polymerases I, II, and III subunit RPABC5 [Nosema bombycis CQ1]
MIIPVRCFTCNKEISSKWESYKFLIKTEKAPADALDSLNLKRICCRRMFLGHVDIIDKLIKFDVARDVNL